MKQSELIQVVPIDNERAYGLASCDFSFCIGSEIPPPFDQHSLRQVTQLDMQYRKSYGFAVEGLLSRLHRPDCLVLAAEVAGRPIGYITASKCWTGFAIIDDLEVDAMHRGIGVGWKLMDAAVEWSGSIGVPGIRLETQSTNVTACRFYERYGFVLGGHDRYLYQALHPGTREVALYWYLFLEQGQNDVGVLSK